MMHFSRNIRQKTLEVTRFSGLNSSMTEADKDLHAASDMANVYVDTLGQIRKRTGYRKICTCGAPVNGIFCYEYTQDGAHKKQYVVHAGTRLYLAAYDGERLLLGACLRTDMENKKSRSFHFGGALYILGAGYYKLVWDAAFRMFFCGRVCKAELEEKSCVLMRECSSNDTDFGGIYSSFADADCRYKEVHFKSDVYGFAGGTKLYIAPSVCSNHVRVTEVYYTEYEKERLKLDPRNYRVLKDRYGLYVELYRADIYFAERILCTIEVRFTYNDFVYVPTNIINRTPTVLLSLEAGLADGEMPHYDGTLLESYSLSSPHRAVEFYLPAGKRNTTSGFRLYLEEAGSKGSVLRIYIDGVLVQAYTANRNGHSEPTIATYQCEYADVEGSILPDTDCILRVEYIKTSAECVTDRCNVFGIFGGNNDTRVFLAGHPEYMARDYASALYDATYFPDTMYTTVGSDKSAIVGYQKISGYQVIIKDGKNFDASQYLRSYSTDEDGKPVFTVLQGAQGVGACSISSFKVCADHMLFAAEDGIYEIRGTQVDAQTNLKHLSGNVDTRLKQLNLSTAVCAVKDGKYYLSVGGQIYVLDTNRDMQWYVYKDLPEICCFYTQMSEIWFGAADGTVYRFMEPTEMNAYYDNVSEDGDVSDAKPICAYWDMPTTVMGAGYKRKSIDDFAIYIVPTQKTSVRVLYTTENYVCADRHAEKVGRFDFENVDFSEFSLEASDLPVCINVRAKAKRVRAFGARIENNVPGENLVITGFALRYRENKEIK